MGLKVGILRGLIKSTEHAPHSRGCMEMLRTLTKIQVSLQARPGNGLLASKLEPYLATGTNRAHAGIKPMPGRRTRLLQADPICAGLLFCFASLFYLEEAILRTRSAKGGQLVTKHLQMLAIRVDFLRRAC